MLLSSNRSSAQKLALLKNLAPYLIDATIRENSVGSKIGLTVENKMAIFQRVKAFGFQRVLLGALNYAMPEELSVEDDFMRALRDQNADLAGCFALTDPGSLAADGSFIPSISQLRLKEYQTPNTIHEIYLSDWEGGAERDWESVLSAIEPSVEWMIRHIKGDRGGAPEIVINIVDGCDAFAQNPDRIKRALEILGKLPIAAVSLEDGRGCFMPFQVGAFFEAARDALPARVKLMAHLHAGAGFENAAMIEALLNGAQGAWGGLVKRTGVIGHASLGELLANLARVGNAAALAYDLPRLLPLCAELSELIDGEPAPADLPILGANAYRLSLDFFQQRPGRFMDLPAEAIGGSVSYRICPVISDKIAILGRLRETIGEEADKLPADIAERMIRLMRRDLRSGYRIEYDQPQELARLLSRALSCE